MLADLRRRGLVVRLRDGRPSAGPRHAVDEADLALLTSHRDVVLAALRWEADVTVARPVESPPWLSVVHDEDEVAHRLRAPSDGLP